MGRDDFFVVTYKILRDLRNQLKMGEYEPGSFTHEAYDVSKRYWERILEMLQRDGYIEGIVLLPVLGRVEKSVKIVYPQITTKGLEFLEENSTLNKAKNFLQDIASIIP